MDRKEFITKALLGTSAAVGVPLAAKAMNQEGRKSTYDKLMDSVEHSPESYSDQVGFNHLPNKELRTMNTVIHRANTRGTADHGWLKANHSFSFANYYNPERMNFGVLRVLNDDYIAGGGGFPSHPHDNMEIITIPLEGDLEHKDSMGNSSVIKHGDVQVMSAGTGILHSEFNHSQDDHVKLIQIWLFPNKRNVTPRYDQISLENLQKNALNQILSPSADDEGVWIHQDAWFSMVELEKDKELNYSVKRAKNGVYAFVINGDVTIEGQELSSRDAMGIWNVEEFSFSSQSDGARILLMDVPMYVS